MIPARFLLVKPEDKKVKTNWNVLRGLNTVKKAHKLIFLPGFRSCALLAAYKQNKSMICYQRGTTHILGDTKNYNTESKYHTSLQNKTRLANIQTDEIHREGKFHEDTFKSYLCKVSNETRSG